MSIIVECFRAGCGNQADILAEADWASTPDSVREFTLRDLDYGDVIYVYLPAGWKSVRFGVDEVIYCPEHAS